MPIVVSTTSVPSTTGNYSGLISSIVQTLDDESLESRIPDFIFRAEAMFNRELYPLNDETQADLEYVEGNHSITLPSDLKKVRSVFVDAVVLKQLDPDDFQKRFLDAPAGPPEAYCLNGSEMLIGPNADTTYALSIKYVRGLQNLSQSRQTNWLIETHPDLYFFGAMMYAELDGWNDERATSFAQTTMEVLERVKFWDAQRRRGGAQDSVPGTYF